MGRGSTHKGVDTHDKHKESVWKSVSYRLVLQDVRVGGQGVNTYGNHEGNRKLEKDKSGLDGLAGMVSHSFVCFGWI